MTGHTISKPYGYPSPLGTSTSASAAADRTIMCDSWPVTGSSNTLSGNQSESGKGNIGCGLKVTGNSGACTPATPTCTGGTTRPVSVAIWRRIERMRAAAHTNESIERMDQSYQRAVDMETSAARSGWLMAHVYLANAYLQSKGVPLDYGEAMHWMRTAAEHGYRQAQANLGSMYRDGQGTSQNYGEAMHWYRMAADQGSAVAEWMIGRLYFDGRGVTRDFTQAATWFRRAAEAGVLMAQWDLGLMYYHGYGVSKDPATAREWLQKAATRGYAPARDMLAKT